MTKIILITGAKGQLGTELRDISHLYKLFRFVFTDIDDLNLSDTAATCSFIAEMKPAWVINCAGYTAVDRAESEPLLADIINGEALSGITAGLSVYGGKLIHISTDFLFNGKSMKPYREEDNPDPLSVYGISKLKGEKIALAYAGSLVIRTSWLYSQFGHNFVKTIIRLASEKESINVVNDQIGTPTYAANLAEVIMKIITSAEEQPDSFKSGIFNYSNEGSCSWYDFANEIKKQAGLKLEIHPVSTAEYPLPANRPAMSVLDKTKIKNAYGLIIPGWKESLCVCLEKIKLANNEN
ncbi:MAG: dTDP-4-dehydrorhamnose reductase [Bacteroidia bacterium]|nr:MAG: dTDP-4-dehydrorhamnose reductase [Bacteroidia bacterium]